MKYRELLNNIIEVASKHPNINSTFIGDVYELNHRNDVDYCAFVITQGTHRVNSDEDYIDYTLNLFYVDRLTADESNRTQIHSSGIDFMNSLLKAVEKLGVVVVEHTENVFNERFNDCCAGVYATVVFRCEIDECGQTIEIITPDELKVLEVTENGIYNGLFKQVDVNVQGGGKEPVLETLNVKDNGTYRPKTGVDGFDIVEVNIPKEIHNVTSKSITANGVYNSTGDEVWNRVDVNVPERQPVLESLSVNANGTYNAPSTIDGYDTVEVNVPERQPVLESLSITDNGTYTPSSGVDGYNSVEVNVPKEHHNVTSKSITANGVYNSDGDDVWNSVDVNVPERVPVLDTLNVISNGTYNAPSTIDGYNTVEVNVPQKTFNKTSLTKEYTANGQYSIATPDGYDGISDVNITVNVPSKEPVLESLSVIDNGTYTPSLGVDGYNSVEVNVTKEHHNVTSKSITENGTYNSDGDDVWNEVSVNVLPKLETLNVTENGTYNPSAGKDGFGRVEVNVPNKEPVLESINVTENGTYTPSTGVDGYNSVTVNVQSSSGTDDYSDMMFKPKLTELDTAKYNSVQWTDLSYKLHGTSLTSIDLSGWNTSNVTDMSDMFSYGALTSINMSGWDTSKVTNMMSMFESCENLTSIDVSHFNTSKVTDMSYMFHYIPVTSIDVSHFNTSNVTNMGNMFSSCYSLKTINVSGWDTSNVTNMVSMFGACWNLTPLDVSHFNTSKVTDMRSMFFGCRSLTSLDVSHFDTSNVMKMYSMFSGCGSLTSLDLSSFNTSKVTTMEDMFYNCTSLTTIISDGLQLPNIELSNIGLNNSPLTVDSIVGLLNALPQTTNNYSFQIGQTNIDKLSEEQKSIATNKGWQLV